MEMWPQGLVWPSLSGLIIFHVPLTLPAHCARPLDAALMRFSRVLSSYHLCRFQTMYHSTGNGQRWLK